MRNCPEEIANVLLISASQDKLSWRNFILAKTQCHVNTKWQQWIPHRWMDKQQRSQPYSSVAFPVSCPATDDCTSGVPQARSFLSVTSMLVCQQIDGLVQDCSISSALALEILQSCTKPSKYNHQSQRYILLSSFFYCAGQRFLSFSRVVQHHIHTHYFRFWSYSTVILLRFPALYN